MRIIIVESPSKSKTIESYMGSDYKVVASQGHIRDLSTKGKGGLGIDIPAGFVPRYEIIKGKEKIVADLKKICQGNEVFLATDPDREGEAISWHLASVLGLDFTKTNRVEFNEITKPAVTEAFKHPRHIDLTLVSSQETRRMLDRIIGFDLSNLLQNKIKTKSAGRVQSAVLKLIVDLEKEILAFKEEAYYQIDVDYKDIKLNLVDDNLKVISFKDKEEAITYPNFLSKYFKLDEIKEKTLHVSPKPALITSTLQQEASNRYGFSSDRTMRVAQSLYEGKEVGDMHVGLITYMRTDSNRLSDQFVNSAYSFIEKNYGKEHLGAYKTKNKANIQDAHEAIRPTSLERTPYLMDKYLTPDERKIYRLIYNKALMSLMADDLYKEKKYVFNCDGYKFLYTAKTSLFKGFSVVSSGDEEEVSSDLNLACGDVIEVDKINVLEKFTKPKSRYTEASIIKAMEDKGIGRPSTYAQTITILKTRKYIEIIEKKIHPTESGKLTVEKLEEYFEDIISPTYTAEMENMLDMVALGKMNSVIELQKFYSKFYPIYEKAKEEMDGIQPEETGDLCPLCGKPLVKRVGKFGDFISCSNYPTCKYKPSIVETEEQGILCPVCLKGHIVTRKSKKGLFYACDQYPKCKTTYPYKPVSVYCEKCGSIMLESPNGLICSNHCEKQEEEIKCPVCGIGHMIKRTANSGKNKGKEFYACNRYPKCKTTFNFKPIPERCEVCGSVLMSDNGHILCSNPKCERSK